MKLNPPGYVVATHAFTVSGRVHGRVAVYALVSILAPLSHGAHTLVGVSITSHPALSVQVTYRLTVG
jgi:hypothetical protein